LYVQLKTESPDGNIVRYRGQAATWLRELGLPLFIGLVNVTAARIRLFSTHIAMRCMLEEAYEAFDLHLGTSVVPAILPDPDTRATVLGPPVLEWTLADIARPGWSAEAYEVLKAWVMVETLNTRCRPLRWFRPMRWETNQPPEDGGTILMGNVTRDDLTPVLRALVPHVEALVREALATPVDQELGVAVLLLLEAMRRRGVDADSAGVHRLLWLRALSGVPGRTAEPDTSLNLNAVTTPSSQSALAGPTTGSSGPPHGGRSA
jgi:hypothetical protein